jgi:2-oxoglutarate ferredoxin oxidoreductase subunit gamma
MSQGSYDQNKAKVNPSQGRIFIDSQLIKPDASLPLKHIPVPATEIALKEFGNRLVANMIVLGAVVKAMTLVSEESLLHAMSNRVSSSLVELNKKALLWGSQWAKRTEFEKEGGS